jgi:HK97 gp10 family phage protein
MPAEIRLTIPPGLHTGSVLLSEEVGKALQNATLTVEAEAKQMAPKATGTLRRSITSAVKPISGTPAGIVSAPVRYAQAVEYGSKPHTPPLQPVQRWAKRKGLPGGAVWMSIRKRGTKPHPFMEPAFTNNKESVIAMLHKALQMVVERMRG